MSRAALYVGDALEVLRTLPDESVQCCVTSPPYWGLRDYGVDGQLGLETDPGEYLLTVVAVFAEVRRVLTADGTLWLNVGDCYANKMPRIAYGDQGDRGAGVSEGDRSITRDWSSWRLKEKDLVGMAWRIAFALQADKWWLRSDTVWHKPNPMPESVTDRPTRAHEYVFLLSKSARYFYDAGAIAEPCKPTSDLRLDERGAISAAGNKDRKDAKQRTKGKHSGQPPQSSGHRIVENVARARAEGADHDSPFGVTRNARSVWTIATVPYPGAHFATFPPELAARCIKAGSRPGDTVLDPFGGSGTTASVATGLGRNAIHIDLNPEYLDLAIERIGPLLVDVKEVFA